MKGYFELSEPYFGIYSFVGIFEVSFFVSISELFFSRVEFFKISQDKKQHK